MAKPKADPRVTEMRRQAAIQQEKAKEYDALAEQAKADAEAARAESRRLNIAASALEDEPRLKVEMIQRAGYSERVTARRQMPVTRLTPKFVFVAGPDHGSGDRSEWKFYREGRRAGQECPLPSWGRDRTTIDIDALNAAIAAQEARDAR